jgi:hypothetical protein
VDQEREEKRAGAPGDVAERTPTEDAAERFQLRLAEVGDGERHRLQHDGVRADRPVERKEQKAPEDKFRIGYLPPHHYTVCYYLPWTCSDCQTLHVFKADIRCLTCRSKPCMRGSV